MSRWIAVFIIFVAIFAQATNDYRSIMAAETLCSDSWYRFIEETVLTSDNQGHGPDVGSGEWKSVIEFKLGIRDNPNLPDRDSEAWCRHIDQIVRKRYAASSEKNGSLSGSVMATGPSYNCDKVEADSIEEMICKDNELSALDRKLSNWGSSLRLIFQYVVFNIFKAVSKFSIFLHLYFYAHNRTADRTVLVQPKTCTNSHQGLCAHRSNQIYGYIARFVFNAAANSF
jgi:hypothetical protein